EGYYQQATVTSALNIVEPATDLLSTVGNFDSGPANDDVRLSFTAPAANGLMNYDVQRAAELCPVPPTSPSWVTPKTLILAGGSGPPASQSSGPPGCAGSLSQTVADIVCGTNMSCALSFDGLTLTLSITANPLDVAAGSAPGVQFPAVITDAIGITDLSGNVW